MSTIILAPNKIVQVKYSAVRVSNLLELKAIEKYKAQHPELSMNAAAKKWIAWRSKHPLQQISGR
jgi:hypothetical protein